MNYTYASVTHYLIEKGNVWWWKLAETRGQAFAPEINLCSLAVIKCICRVWTLTFGLYWYYRTIPERIHSDLLIETQAAALFPRHLIMKYIGHI